MSEIVRISDEELAVAHRRSRIRLKERNFFERYSESGFPDRESFAAAYSMQSFLATSYAVRRALEKNIASPSKNFPSIYSIYAGCLEALKAADEILPADSVIKPALSLEFKIGGLSQSLNSEILEDKIISRYLEHSSSAARSKGFFESLKELAESESQNYPQLLKQAAGWKVHVNSLVLEGFGVKNEQTAEISQIDYGMIVGNSEAIAACRSIMSRLACYDPETQTNALLEKREINKKKAKPITALLHGEPGCGKTLLLQAAAYDLHCRAQKKELPFALRKYDNTHKSKWHGESAKIISQVFFEAIKNPAGIGIGIIDDIDTIMQSRDDYDSSQAEEQILGVILDELDGTTTCYRGNYAIIAGTNKPKNLDDALSDRFQFNIKVPGAQTPEEYLRLLKAELRGLEEYLISENIEQDLERIAGIAWAKKISGRKISHAAEKLIYLIAPTVPEEITLLSPAEQAKADFYNKIRIEELEEMIK